MKYLRLLLLSFSVPLSMFAQGKTGNYQVIGQIIEKITGKGVPYATVSIKNDSIKLKKAQACDASGNFYFNLNVPVKYIIIVSSVGYKEFSIPINVSMQKTDLGKLSMEEKTLLKEVTITAQKPLVKIDVDKIVYSMESDPESQGNNTLEMLRKVPLITLDAEENITLNGQSNFKVLVNGKSSSMMSANLREALRGLPANTIRDIEVITNPSSKYDAEGVGGIINIITSKKTIDGYNGSVSGGGDVWGGLNIGAYMATKIKKFSISARYSDSKMKQPESITNNATEYFNNTDYHYSQSDGHSTRMALSRGFSGEAGYEIDSLNLISISFWGYKGSNDNIGFTETQYMNSSDGITRSYNSNIKNGTSYVSLSGNIDYQKTFKKPDKSLTFSYKLDNSPLTIKATSEVDGIINYPSYSQISENDALAREQTIQADYFDPINKKSQLESGIKFILRQNTSTSEISRDSLKLNNGNDLDYNQYIMAAYASYTVKWKKFSTKSGLRLERTWNYGKSTTSGINTDFTNNLFSLVPYVTFSFIPKQGQTIVFSYTQRLSRPGIWYLNPYVNNSDSLNISYGNPLLKSEVSHSFELGYSYFTPKINLSVTSSSSFTNNSIERISTVKSNGATVNTYKNIGKDHRYGLNLYASYRPSGKFNFFFNGGGNYSKLEANNGYSITNSGFSFRGSLGGRWLIWKEGSLNATFGVNSSVINLQGNSSAYTHTSIGISQYFLKRKLMFNVIGIDPFSPRKRYTNELNDITFYSLNQSSIPAQNVRFSLSYNFGKVNLQVKKARRGIKNDDLKSGGENLGGGTQQ